MLHSYSCIIPYLIFFDYTDSWHDPTQVFHSLDRVSFSRGFQSQISCINLQNIIQHVTEVSCLSFFMRWMEYSLMPLCDRSIITIFRGLKAYSLFPFVMFCDSYSVAPPILSAISLAWFDYFYDSLSVETSSIVHFLCTWQ